MSVPTEVAENACESPQNQGFLNELHSDSVKHGLAFRWDAERSTLFEAARQLGVSLVGIPVDSP